MIRVLGLVMVLAGCQVPTADKPPPADAPDEREYVLDDPEYRFCHEAGPYSADTRPWCTLKDQIDISRCPGFHELCARSPEDDVYTDLGGGCLGGGGGPPTSSPAGEPDSPGGGQDWTPSASSCEPPETSLGWLASVAKWLVAAVIALGVLVVLRLIFWAIAQRRAGDLKDEPQMLAARAPLIESVADNEIPDMPSDDLLSAAELALAEDRVSDAILLARAAALRHLGDTGIVRLHRSRTDREYLRSIRRKPDIEGPLRVVVRWVELLRWGGNQATSQDAASVLSAVRKLIGTVALLCIVALAMGADGDYRYGPHGDAAIADLYERADYKVSWRLRSLANIDEETDVLVLDLSGIQPAESDWEGIRSWVADGGVLVVAGAVQEGYPQFGEWAVATSTKWTVASGITRPLLPEGELSGWTNESAVPLVADSASGTVFVSAYYQGTGVVYGISDERLLWNASLLSANNEQFLLDLFDIARFDPLPEDASQTTVQLALLASASSGSDNPLQSLWNAQLLPFLLQLLLTMAVASLWLGWPFAPLKDPEEGERQHFSDHVSALGHRYQRLRARPWVIAAYARWALLRFGQSGLQARAERGGRSAKEAEAWAERARNLAEGHETSDDLNEMEDLWKTTHRD
jgi:hypothetical protein